MIEIKEYNGKQYKVLNNTWYNVETLDVLVELLEKVRLNKTRIIIDYGNPETGKSWGETFDIVGRIGRTTGEVKSPILLYNSRSIGGGIIMTDKILSLKTSIGQCEFWRHQNYKDNVS